MSEKGQGSNLFLKKKKKTVEIGVRREVDNDTEGYVLGEGGELVCICI